ncbi:hypothetical protein QQF64_006053 [Cirrhinus molitorella]|uniref:PDZ domain-containing protein n=1 Tax=Cirrhinus molitorella TaxID=172907 RepID=A0ABR3MDX8_9TELE
MHLKQIQVPNELFAYQSDKTYVSTYRSVTFKCLFCFFITTGEGRRLKGPEQDTDDDLVCEEPEVLEGERPRPQGSSPVEDFPATEKYSKQAEGDFYDSPNKGSKKSKRIGFGSLFDKRSSAKMNQTEDMQSDQSEIIVKTVKEVCAEGLVVSGGKDGIFIKEVKPETPASKHLSVKEGDQLLSATVYFDNVSYEDALQILEHAQPYKVAFCLKRKPLPRTQEDAETMRPDTTIGEEAEQEEEGRGPEMRGRRKTKKQHDRISWPKFPTFSKGRRANFKRSHSTSEAEEQRKLEISPPTSDTESPLKSPLKSPDGKEKKKMHKIKLKKRMTGRRSKSVEETQENEQALAADTLEVMDHQVIMNITEEQVPVINLIESPKILNEAEKTDSAITRNEYAFPTLPATESLHKVELISVDTTLKTSDITVALGDDGKERRETAELKISVPGKDKYEIETESQLKSSTSGMRTSTFDNILDSPNILSQSEPVGHQVDSDIKQINKEILQKTQESGKTDISVPKVDVSLDKPEVGPISKSPRIGSDREKKEINILETESYGIRTRGPLADIATSKSHFSNAVNKLDFTSDTFSFEIQTREDVSSTDTKKPITPTPVISQPKSHVLDVDRSRKSTGASTDIESEFKLPKVDVSEFDHLESITVKQKDPTKVPLLKREEIEIPGMEDKAPKGKVKSPRIKEQKVEKIINISKAEKKQVRGKAEEFNVEDVKEAVSKFPAFKLPERDITGVLVQREVTIMEMKSDKTVTTPKGSPSKISSMSTEINIKLPETMDKEKQRLSPVATKDQAFVLPKTDQVHLDETFITESKKSQQSKTGKMLTRDDKRSTSPDVKFKLPKREDIEIPGMEAIEQSVQPQKVITDTQDEAEKDFTDTDIKAEKKSKKSKVSLPSFGIMTPDIRFPGIAIELPIKTTSSKSDSGAIKEMKTEAKIPLDEDHIKKSPAEATFEKSQKTHDIEGDQMLHHDVGTAIVKETSKQDAEGELKAEIKSKDTDSSPQKKKLPKLKMPKIGGKMKGTAEATTKEDVTVQENDIMEVALDSEKRTPETDPKAYSAETDKNWSKIKMPSIDVSVPKIKIPKAEGKSKQEETGLSKPEAVIGVEDAREDSGFRPIKFGISMPKERTEDGGLLPDESKKATIKVSGKTEVEPSELTQAEMKEAESKMKKRKISFPKFGFSKSDTKVPDADITTQHEADGSELDVESKTTDVEAEFKDSTDSPTKFKLPTIKLPKFGVSFPKTSDAGADIQMPDVSTDKTTMDVKLPEAKLSVEATALSDKKTPEITVSVSKPEVDLSLHEGKGEIKSFQKKEIKSSEEISFSKPDIDASLTHHDVKDIKAAGVDVSLPQVDLSIPEGSVEIREPDVNLTISKDEAKHKDLAYGGTPVKFKLPSISLPKFGGKKIAKDMPDVDIDIEDPDISLPETQISLRLKDEAPSVDVKDSFETTEGQAVRVDMKAEEAKLKEQGVTITLPKFGISLPKVEAHKTADSTDKEESTTEPKESNAESDQPEKDPRSPTKMKLPTIKFPKFGVSFPKSTDAVSDKQMAEVTKDEPTMDIKAPEIDVNLTQVDTSKPESDQAEKDPSSPTKIKLPTIKFPKFGVSVPKSTDAVSDNQMSEVTKDKPTLEIKAPETKITLETDDVVFTSVKGPDVKISVPSQELKKPTISVDLPKVEGCISLPEAELGKLSDKAEVSQAKLETKIDQEADLKDMGMKMKKTGFSLPKFGFSKPDIKAPETDVSIAQADTSKPESEQVAKDPRSPTKMKLPTIKFPKFGVSLPKSTDASVSENQMFEATKDEPTMEMKAPDTELSAELPSLPEMKTHIILSVSKPEVDVIIPEVEKAIDADLEKKKEKVLSPEISKPEFKMSLEGHGLDQEIAIEDLKVQAKKLEKEFKLPTGSVDEVIVEAKQKESKKRKISFPKFGFSKSDTKVPDVDTSLQKEGLSVPDTEIKETEVTIPAPEVEVQLKDKSTSGSPSKFKLPTISLPKFDISISKTGEESIAKAEDDAQSEIKATSAVASQDKDTGAQDTDASKSTFEIQPLDVEIKTKYSDPGSQGSRFMMPKFEFSFPKIKGPELKKGASGTDAETTEVSLKHDKESAVRTENIPGASVEMEAMMKKTKMLSSEHKFSKQDIKAPEIEVKKGDTSMAVGDVDVNLESDLKIQTTEILKDDSTTAGSPSKFKLPTFKLPKFGSSSYKVKAEITDLRGEEITLETEVEGPDVKISMPSQELKKPTISVDQPKAEGCISLPEAELGELSAKAEVSQAKLESKIDQDTGMKMKKTGFSLPKFGFSKPDIKAPEIDVNLPQVDASKPEGDVKIKEQSMNITVLDVEDDQKDTTEFKLPSISIPKIGGKATKEEITMPVVDVAVKGPELSGPDTQIKISGEVSSVDIKGPHLATEGQSVSVDLNVEDVELGGQGGKFKMPRFGIGLPKVKGFDLSTSKTGDITEIQQIDIKKPEITTEGMVHPPEQDSKDLDVQMKTSAEFGFTKPELKATEVDVNIQKTDIPIPEGSLDIEGANLDIKVSKTESDQKGSTIFGSPTKFKLPTLSLPKFGVKSQKAALDVNVTDSELEGTNIKTDLSKPDVKLEVQPPSIEAKVEGGVDVPEIDSKGLQVKVKRPSFSFPKFGFSKQDTATPEVNVSVPKAEVSIPEVDVTVKDQTAEVTLPRAEAKQKDLTIVTSPTKFKLPEVNLPKFGGKTSKGTVSLPSADKDIKGIEITAHEPDIRVSGQIPKFDLDVKEIETDIHATIKETDVHLVEGKVILPQPDVDIQGISIEAKAEMPEVDLKGHDVKLKKPSFSLPKFGFSKPDIKEQDVDASQPKVSGQMPKMDLDVKQIKTNIHATITETDVHLAEGKVILPQPDVDVPEISIKSKADMPEVDMKGHDVKLKMPSFSLPKFGFSKPDIKGQDVDANQPKVSGQIPKIDLDAKEIETDIHATTRETDIQLVEGKVKLPQPDVDVQGISIEGKADMPEVDLKGHDVKLKKPSFSLPKFGFSKPDIKGQDIDASQPKIDMSLQKGNIPVKVEGATITITDEVNKQGDTTTKFKLPTINLPKFGLKYPKATADIPAAEVDIKEPEFSFPEKGEVQTTDTKTNIDIKGPSVDVDIKVKEIDTDGTGSKFKMPKFGIGMPKVKETKLEGKEINIETGLLCEGKLDVQQPSVEIQNVTIEGKTDKVEVDSKGLKGKLPKLGFSKPDLKAPEVDVSLPKADMSVGNVEASEQSADIKLPQEPDLKEDTFGSPTKFKLPTINFPKFGTKASKDTVDIPTVHKDIKVPEVSLPDKTLNMSGEASSVEMKEPTVEDPSIEISIKRDDKEQQEGKFKVPKFGIALPIIKGPDSDQGLKKALTETEVKVSGGVPSIDKKELKLPKGTVDVEVKGPELEVEESKIKLPQFGISLDASKSPEIYIGVSKVEVSQPEVKEYFTVKDVVVEEPADFDMSSKGLGVKMKKPSFGFSKIGFSKSEGKAPDIQDSETAADLSLPEGTTEIGESEREGKTEITSPQFGSPTKFKLPTIKLPKFGVSTPKVSIDAAKADSETMEIKVSSVDYEIETSKVDPSGDIKGKTAEIKTPSIDINIKEKEPKQEGQEIKFKLPKFGISLPKVKGPEVTITGKDVKTETPETGITGPEIKVAAEDASLPKIEMALEGSSSIDKKEVETELKDDTAISGSPSKFKLPTFKMPKFGTSAQKTSYAKVNVAEVDLPDTNTDLNIEDKPVQVSKELQRKDEIKETTEQPPEAATKKLDGDKGSPSKFKLPTIKMPKISISRTKSQEGEDEATTKANAPEAKTEPKDDTQGPGKSPKFTMPSLEDVLKGFEVEFNVPTIEEMEAQKDKPSVKQDQEAGEKVEEAAEHKDKGAQEKSKFKFKFPKLGFSQSSDESDKLVDAKIEESEKHLEASADQKATVSKEQAKTEKGSWFKFSFSSPTKTAKIDEKEIIEPPEETEKPDEKVEKESSKPPEEPEKSSLSEAVEENLSPTLSLKSSEAFADISSTVTTEQIALSQTSPTKVKVKYAEPTATVGVNDVQSNVVTSTARCELISMEPHQPEKVNIPFSSDMSSGSVDTLKQMSGEIHVITTNIQAIPETQQASILTNLDAHGIHTSPLQITLGSDSVLTVEETRVQSGMHTLVERHVVKETLHDDKETILVTHRTRVFEGDSAEPISDETASSIRRLKDTVHTEKMRFFDSVATAEEVTIVSSETSLRHMDSSTDENEGK